MKKKAGRGEGGGGLGERREGSCWSSHCWGSGEIQVALLRGAVTTAVSDEIQIALLLEQSLLRRGEIQKRLLRE